MKENGAAGERNRGSLARLTIVGGVVNEGDGLAPRASVESSVNARGMWGTWSDATKESPVTVLFDCGG